jgi:hypothetical protein
LYIELVFVRVEVMETAEGLEHVAAGLTALADVDLDVLSADEVNETLVALQRLSHALAAQVCRVAHRWDQTGVWSADGSRSASARLARDGHTSQSSARTMLLRGRRLDTAPHVAAAFATGELSTDQVDLLLGASAGREVVFERDEQTLVSQARSLRVAELTKILAYWRQRADAELDNDGPEPAVPVASLTITPIDGAVAIGGELDPVGAQIVTTALDTIADELATRHPEHTRSRAQLRAAALVEMARRAMAMPADGRPARILANIACGNDTFAHLCELSNGTIIHPAQLVPYLDALDIRSILYDTTTHAITTSRRRTFTGALRAAIEVRDRHCQHPSGCDEPIDHCDFDHVVPWSHGGTTSQDNARLLCTYHNRIEPQHARPPTPPETINGCTIHRITYAELIST